MRTALFLLIFLIPALASAEINVKYYKDVSREKKIDDILRLDANSFEHIKNPSFGFSDSAYWVKIVYKNQTNKIQEKIFELIDSRLDRVEVYDENAKELSVVGDMLPFNNRHLKYENVTILLKTDKNSEVVRYLRVTNSGPLDINYKLWDVDEYISYEKIELSAKSFFFGVIFVMLIYNFIIFLFIRERAFFDYVVYHSVLFMAMLYYNGVVGGVILPDSANLNANNMPISMLAFGSLMATQFARSFLNTKEIVPKLDKLLLFLMTLGAVNFILSIFEFSSYYLFTMIVMMMESFALFFTSAYMIFIKRNRLAQLYLVGWLVFMIAVVSTGMINLSIISHNIFTDTILQIGIIIEVTLLSMGLAYRYNQKRNELIEKDKALKVINENLEMIVQDRTHKLNEEVKNTNRLLSDKEVLFKELYHRVKNNLQMLISILSMQKRRIADENSKAVLEDVIGRIKSISLIHEKLQTSAELSEISVQEYLESLMADIKNGFPKINLSIEVKCKNIFMDINFVTSIGLIINELVTNSFKYAFEHIDNPQITVHLKEVDGDCYELYYSDNGNGVDKVKESLGSVLIETLSKSQLKGSLRVVTQPSLSYRIVFPKEL